MSKLKQKLEEALKLLNEVKEELVKDEKVLAKAKDNPPPIGNDPIKP